MRHSPDRGHAALVLAALRDAAGGIVSTTDLVDVLYGDRPDGGPVDAAVARGAILALRRSGHQIERAQAYRLVGGRVPRLTRRQAEIVDAIRALDTFGGRPDLAAVLGASTTSVGTHLTRARRSGLRLELVSSYRLIESGSQEMAA